MRTYTPQRRDDQQHAVERRPATNQPGAVNKSAAQWRHSWGSLGARGGAENDRTPATRVLQL